MPTNHGEEREAEAYMEGFTAARDWYSPLPSSGDIWLNTLYDMRAALIRGVALYGKSIGAIHVSQTSLSRRVADAEKLINDMIEQRRKELAR